MSSYVAKRISLPSIICKDKTCVDLVFAQILDLRFGNLDHGKGQLADVACVSAHCDISRVVIGFESAVAEYVFVETFLDQCSNDLSLEKVHSFWRESLRSSIHLLVDSCC